MVTLSYIGFGLLILNMAAVAGAVVSEIKGQARRVFASPWSVLIEGMILGVPCFFIVSYLQSNGNGVLLLLVLLVAAPLGLLLGLKGRGQS